MTWSLIVSRHWIIHVFLCLAFCSFLVLYFFALFWFFIFYAKMLNFDLPWVHIVLDVFLWIIFGEIYFILHSLNKIKSNHKYRYLWLLDCNLSYSFFFKDTNNILYVNLVKSIIARMKKSIKSLLFFLKKKVSYSFFKYC